MKRRFIPLFLCAMTLMWLSACGGGNPNPPSPDPNPNPKSDTDTIVPPPVAEPVSQALLFMDNSTSMKGYASDITGYINVLTQLSRAYGNTSVLLCCDEYKTLELAEGKSIVDGLKALKYGGSSLLHQDLQTMVSRVKNDNLVFFVTDGIMSGSGKDIKGNAKWTLEHAADLKLQVKDVFSKAREQQVALSVYQFRAAFKGAYYCYDNASATIDTPRPFYVFVMGRADNVKEFKDKFAGTEYFQPVAQLHFIDALPLQGGLAVRDARKEGKDYVFSLTDVNNKAEDKEPGLLPVVLKSDLFLNNLSQAEVEQLAPKFQITAGNKNILADEVSYDEKRGFSFLVNPNAQKEQFTVELKVPYELPAWVRSSSVDELTEGDKYMARRGQADGRTFLLLHLIDGIRQGLLGDESLLYHDTVTLRQSE